MYKINQPATATLIAIILILACCSCAPSQQTWKPANGPLMTRWAKNIDPQNPLPDYPRPQMARQQWISLNGQWQYAIMPKEKTQPKKFQGNILVPFCAESALSGVMKTVGPENNLWYKRSFNVPSHWKGRNILLNFGAVDWQTTVWVNGQQVGTHKGGYDPFSFDITDVLNDQGPQQIIVEVWDPTDAGTQPRGKQVNDPNGIWYTPVTGIWQTVWLEPATSKRIERLKIKPNIDRSMVNIAVICTENAEDCTIQIEVKDPLQTIARTTVKPGQQAVVPIRNQKLWSPDSPKLYALTVTLKNTDGTILDTVNSYFAMRKISLDKDTEGITRVFLNNKPLFQYGTLDQGWWPDGLYTAPTDNALKYDIEITKQLGFNMIRKHVKVEPDRWYYWADYLGILVWQDMPNGDRHIGQEDPDIIRTSESAAQYELELKNIIDVLHNHQSIVMWVPFNEGWGQFDTARITDWIKKYDSTRLVNSTSGWADRNTGDVLDIHAYPGPAIPPLEDKRAAVLGEFGGLGLPIENHTWTKKDNWGYKTLQNPDQLTKGYGQLMQKLHSMIERGLAAAVYTQTTDVETEVNGLMTYDRAEKKMSVDKVVELNKKLYQPVPK